MAHPPTRAARESHFGATGDKTETHLGVKRKDVAIPPSPMQLPIPLLLPNPNHHSPQAPSVAASQVGRDKEDARKILDLCMDCFHAMMRLRALGDTSHPSEMELVRLFLPPPPGETKSSHDSVAQRFAMPASRYAPWLHDSSFFGLTASMLEWIKPLQKVLCFPPKLRQRLEVFVSSSLTQSQFASGQKSDSRRLAQGIWSSLLEHLQAQRQYLVNFTHFLSSYDNNRFGGFEQGYSTRELSAEKDMPKQGWLLWCQRICDGTLDVSSFPWPEADSDNLLHSIACMLNPLYCCSASIVPEARQGILASALGQLSSVLGTIAVQDDATSTKLVSSLDCSNSQKTIIYWLNGFYQSSIEATWANPEFFAAIPPTSREAMFACLDVDSGYAWIGWLLSHTYLVQQSTKTGGGLAELAGRVPPGYRGLLHRIDRALRGLDRWLKSNVQKPSGEESIRDLLVFCLAFYGDQLRRRGQATMPMLAPHLIPPTYAAVVSGASKTEDKEPVCAPQTFALIQVIARIFEF